MSRNRIKNIDRKVFYEAYRAEFGSIKLNKTIETINAMLDKGEDLNLLETELAYIFATAHHEARDRKHRNDFYPLMERGGWDYIVNQYWHNSRVRGWLGNTSINKAWLLRGRGLVQITGETNYTRYGLQDDPDKALEINVAVHILFDGMINGVFTGKKLKDYISNGKVDYVNARRIVNGTDKAALIASNALKFEVIINQSNIL